MKINKNGQSMLQLQILFFLTMLVVIIIIIGTVLSAKKATINLETYEEMYFKKELK